VVFDGSRYANHREAHLMRPEGVAVAGLLGELTAIVGWDRGYAVRHIL
jgi:hypothetical protein